MGHLAQSRLFLIFSPLLIRYKLLIRRLTERVKLNHLCVCVCVCVGGGGEGEGGEEGGGGEKDYFAKYNSFVTSYVRPQQRMRCYILLYFKLCKAICRQNKQFIMTKDH